MTPNEQEFAARARRLLEAGKPAYPEGLDRQLRERLSRVATEKGVVLLGQAFPRRALVASLAAMTLLAVAGLVWWSSRFPQAKPGTVPRVAGTVAGPRPVSVPPPVQIAALPAPSPVAAPKVAAKNRAAGRGHGAVSRQPVRIEFTIPESSITILWEQRGDFELAALVAAR